jgi:GT2 family glycosyltransferase
MRAGALTVVIPTRDRWPILRRTLDALAQQTVAGFDVVVSVDGGDVTVPDLQPARVVVQRTGGSGAARNAGVAEVRTPLMLLLDDDMVPTPNLVARHLDVHERHPEQRVAALGRVVWHPELAPTPVSRWLDWSGMMFPFEQLAGLAGEDVGWGRFVSCNASLKTAFLRDVGGFDETFIHYYEDTDLAKRLGERAMQLVYEPGALAQHLQRFGWDDVCRRFERVAIGERLMVRKHADFVPWFEPMMASATDARTSRVWPHVADRVPARWHRLRAAARRRAHRTYLARLAPSYLGAYRRANVLCELMDHLGDQYDPRLLINSDEEVDREARAIGDEERFYRTSTRYPYNLTVFEMSGTKEPYRRVLAEHLPPGATVLDYGCGIGSDGLALLDEGFRVSFADFANPSMRFLRWRLGRRGLTAPIHDLDADMPGGFDAVFAFDVIEHVEDPFAFLDRLESLARVVAVNLLEPDPHETDLHRPLPIPALLDHVRSRRVLATETFYGRSHLVVYESPPQSAAAAGSVRGGARSTAPDSD